jgi:acyl-coenzyme A synthetase/AMP-(fatty) acid ligase/acyl carrier protein
VIPPSGVEKDPEEIGRLIKEHQVTILLSLPSVYNFLMTNTALEDIASLKIVIVAGETCTNEIVKKHHQIMTRARLHNEYGPTEGSVWCSACELIETESEKNISIGRPIPNSRVYVLDENLRIVPPGVPGGLFIGGEGVTRGYYMRPDLTAEKFVPDPFDRTGGRRLYRTGDIGRYRNDGSLEFRGREDEQVKIRGYRIELGEIESVIGEIEGIEECVVAVFQDSTDHKKIVGYVVSNNGAVTTGESIRSYLKGKLPDYMIPQTIQQIERIPRLPNGKVNRHALAKPVVTREHFDTSFVPPSNKIEAAVAGIWAEALEIDRIGINDNFFDLGGHSFMIIKVHDQIQKQLNIAAPLVRLFEYPTVSSFAGFIASQNAEAVKEKSYENWADRRKKSMRSRVRL